MVVRLQTIWWDLRDRMVGEDGATMPEYALMVALIAAVAFFGAQALGIGVDARFDDITTKIAPAAGGGGS